MALFGCCWFGIELSGRNVYEKLMFQGVTLQANKKYETCFYVKVKSHLDVDKPVADNACEFVAPAADHGALFAEEIGVRQAHTGGDAREVAQVEDVVELGRCGW